MKKIRILAAIRQGQIGGGEKHVLDIVENIDKNCFEIFVLSFTHGEMVNKLKQQNVPVYVIQTEQPFDFLIWSKVTKLVRKLSIDIIHAHGTRAASNCFSTAKLLGIPFTYTIHGWSFHHGQSHYSRKSRIFCEKFLVNMAKPSIFVSQSNLKEGNSYFNIKNPLVIKNGVNLRCFTNNSESTLKEELNIPDNSVLIGFIARLTYQKDPLSFIKAASIIINQKGIKNVYFLLVGDGELRDECSGLIDKEKLNQHVIMTGFRQDIPNILKALDIYCLPSLWEGLPIGILEAMAMAKPVVCTSVDGSNELVKDNHNGILVALDSPKNLADALSKLTNDKTLRESMGYEGMIKIHQDHTIEKMVDRLQNVYTKLKMNNGNMEEIMSYDRIADIKRLRFIEKNIQESHISTSGKVLDVGCGNGNISRFLGSKGYDVLGIDISAEAIQKASSMNKFDNVEFKNIRAEDIDTRFGHFDVIICSEVLEHLDRPDSLLQALSGLLSNDGILIVTVPNGYGPRELLITKPFQYLDHKRNWVWKIVVNIKKWLGYNGTTVQSDAEDLTHIQFFTRRKLYELSKKIDFSIVKFHHTNFIDDVFPFSLIFKRFKFLQRIDSRMADLLPYQLTGGFNTIWRKRS